MTMRGLLLIVLLLLSACASARPRPAVSGPKWLDLSQLRDSDYVCASGSVLAPCAPVRDVRAFLGTVRVEP